MNQEPDFISSVSQERKMALLDYYLNGNRADCCIKQVGRKKRANSFVCVKWRPVSNFFSALGEKKKVRFFTVLQPLKLP